MVHRFTRYLPGRSWSKTGLRERFMLSTAATPYIDNFCSTVATCFTLTFCFGPLRPSVPRAVTHLGRATAPESLHQRDKNQTAYGEKRGRQNRHVTDDIRVRVSYLLFPPLTPSGFSANSRTYGSTTPCSLCSRGMCTGTELGPEPRVEATPSSAA